MPGRALRLLLLRLCLAGFIHQLIKDLPRALGHGIWRSADFLGDGSLIKDETLPDFGRIGFQRQCRTAVGCAGGRRHMIFPAPRSLPDSFNKGLYTVAENKLSTIPF